MTRADNKHMFLMGDLIVIKHELMGNSLEAKELGPMSMELALWLEYKLQEEDFRKHNDEDNLAGIQYFLNRDPYLKELVTRSQLAAMRGYKPKLAEQFDYLTPQGYEKAKKARIVIKEINETLDNIVYDPGMWKKTDEFFVTAGIPRRCANMLNMMDKALKQAKQNFDNDPDKEHLPPVIFGEEDKPLKKDQTPKLTLSQSKHRELSEIDLQQPRPVLSDIKDNLKKTELPPEFDTLTFYGELSDESTRCWVPTAAFGQNARNDLNVLIRYGLVDLKQYNIGSKGRPKHIIRVSRVGQLVLKDMQELRLV